jgi:hypothetical protein
MTNQFLSATAILLTFVLFVPYIRGIRRGTIRPHAFSWIIWGLVTFIVFLAQLAGHAGVGAWPIGVSGLITFGIALLAYAKRGDTHITRSDWWFFAAAVAALPVWAVTADPLWAVVILTAVDLVGFGPTVRVAYHRPHQESALFFGLAGVRNALVVMALEHYSVTTVLFPAAVGAACLLLAVMLLGRRRQLAGAPARGSRAIAGPKGTQ